MPTFALDCQLDGRGFAGTALQPGARTVSGILREALSVFDGAPVLTRSCGRLDAGVSAESLVFSCRLQRPWSARALALGLNRLLPAELQVQRVGRVPEDWDALAAATGKQYRYQVLERLTPAPLLPFSHWLRGPLAADALAACAAAIVGRHDLGAFSCLRGDGSDQADATRTYHVAEWYSQPWCGGRRWEFHIHGQGFLYKQVRGLVGAMLAVAQGRETLANFLAAIGQGRLQTGRAADRVGQIAPARGLCLLAASFDPEPEWLSLACAPASTD